MGNQGSSMNSKRSYYSIEYLNGPHDSLIQRSNSFQTKSDYEWLNGQATSKLITTNSRSSHNLIGLVREGAVLVQRSRSFVKPENRVLPLEKPTKPLRPTNLLRSDGFKKTWRKNIDSKEGVLKNAFQSQSNYNLAHKELANDLNDFSFITSTENHNPIKQNIKYSKSASNLNELDCSSKSKQFSSLSMLIRNKLENNSEQLSMNRIKRSLTTDKVKNSSTRNAFINRIKSLSKKKPKIESIKVISGFPIDSKIYRHYISGKGNTFDKLTSSTRLSKLATEQHLSKNTLIFLPDESSKKLRGNNLPNYFEDQIYETINDCPEKQKIKEFYLRSTSCDSDSCEYETSEEHEVEIRVESNKEESHITYDMTNFILKPKENEYSNAYQTIVDTKHVKKPTRRRGLHEIFPHIDLTKFKEKSCFQIRDPNWCPASDLHNFEDSIEPQKPNKPQPIFVELQRQIESPYYNIVKPVRHYDYFSLNRNQEQNVYGGFNILY